MIAVILLAGGNSSRMGPKVTDKSLIMIGNRSVFSWSIHAFAASDVIDVAVVVHRDDSQREALVRDTSACPSLPKVIWTKGGKKRSDSVHNGLQALPEETDAVFIHDCARPLIRPATLISLSKALSKHRAVALGRKITDTVKITETTETENLFLTKAVDRRCLWAMETPQVFEKNLILRAHAHAAQKNETLTDDVSAVEALGEPVFLLEAGYQNPKITTLADLRLVESLISENNP